MCGLAGIVNGRTEDLDLVVPMTEALRHRGPDDYGYFKDPDSSVAMGSRRLSIVDLSENGRMPLTNENGEVFVCQNGEIYNYPSLYEELKSLGHRFVSTSDTEVIVHGFEEWGPKVFAKLQGMFALVVFDKRKKSTYLVRDRFGIKPLYYLKAGEAHFYASEVKSFLKLPPHFFNRELDLSKIRQSLGFMFLPDSASTIFQKVKKIPPGHYLEITPGGSELTRYYDLQKNWSPFEGTFEEAVDELDRLLARTVKEHLMSDVPLGVLLSGGLDSSLVTALMKRTMNSRLLTFTAKFNHPFDESEKALKVARHLGTEHQEITIDPEEINREIENCASDLDDLTTFDGGLITTKILCREIKKRGVTVLLLGEGADEVFGGYSWFGLSQFPFARFPRRLLSSLYYYAISRNVTFNPVFYYSFFQKVFSSFSDPDLFRTIANLEIQLQLPNHLLMKVDKGAMAASIEARVPYLDHKVVEFVHGLPRSFKLKGDWFDRKALQEKFILRKVAERYLPPELISSKKRGFMLPMREVLWSNLEKVKSYALDPSSLTLKMLGRKTLEDLFNKSSIPFLEMQREYLLWRIFLLEVWHRNYGRE